MAVTGLMMIGFLIMHLLGNTLIFSGAEKLDLYGEMLHTFPEFLWILRGTMIGALGIHVYCAATLATTRTNRGVNYSQYTHHAATASSRFMRISGMFILAYIIFHLLDLTVGAAFIHPTYQYGKVYGNLTATAANPIKLAVYIMSASWVAFHVYHATYSVLQTLGLNQENLEFGRKAGLGLSLLLGLGNISIILYAAYLGFNS
jgi:succinate dehydrogenase / fumarate reductase cytochrome b subunit